ncbi:The BTB (BR-C, ttk and bab)/POZ (Pox virus and Zinc finger) domain [Ceratobasidium sp. AG-Ba]|nr:The BTB (BR-C, ttk and bab)/POZ (Pox virus and Zinc finger) domain [Ceratobasidium sp. AG-Ba]
METETPQAITFSYQPPPGGDITLKSADGIVFIAHSLLLTMASSVFANMISTANLGDTVELSDDAVSISLMLRFIYPPTFMDDLHRDLLEKSLAIAQKYDIAGIITSVDHLMYDPSNQGSPLKSDPIYTFCMASTFDLPKTKKAALDALQPGHFSFTEAKQILPLAQTFPRAASAIGLLGSHCARTQQLTQLLLGEERIWIFPHVDYMAPQHDRPMCEKCVDEILEDLEMHVIENMGTCEPTWLGYWSIIALHDLTTRPLDQCAHLFSWHILEEIKKKPGVCQECVQVARDVDGGLGFVEWAKRVKARIEKIHKSVDALYNI